MWEMKKGRSRGREGEGKWERGVYMYMHGKTILRDWRN